MMEQRISAEDFRRYVPHLTARFAKGGHLASKEQLPWKTSDMHHPPLVSLDEGSVVRGPGKGQEDLIKTATLENSYIVDASTTSMIGDGSSHAGGELLKKFEDEIQNRLDAPKRQALKTYLHKTTKEVPVYLSDYEYRISPMTVMILGHGNPSKGSKILKRFIEDIRHYKSSKGKDLPPKCKPLLSYLTKAERE